MFVFCPYVRNCKNIRNHSIRCNSVSSSSSKVQSISKPAYPVVSPSDSVINVSKSVNPLSANFTKWSNTVKQFVGKLPTNYLSVFDHFVGLALKGLIALPLIYILLISVHLGSLLLVIVIFALNISCVKV